MAVFNREAPFDHAHGLVQDHEPFFFQNGCAFTQSGVEVFKDRMGNFSLSAEEAEALAAEKAAEQKAVEEAVAALAAAQVAPADNTAANEVAPVKKVKTVKDPSSQSAEDDI